MKPKVELLAWEKILLDTSTVLNYLKMGSTDRKMDEQIKFTHKLIDFLVDTPSQQGNTRQFYISAITLMEIRTLNSDPDVFKEIAYALNAGHIEVIPVDRKLAHFININAGKLLTNQSLNARIAQDLPNSGDYSLMREWLIKDYQIAFSAMSHNCDTVITADERTFKPACTLIGCPCVVTNPDYFNHGGKNVFYYQGT